MVILSYRDIHDPDQRRRRIQASISTGHPESACGQPVIVLQDGQLVRMKSLAARDYQVEKTTKKELAALERMGLI
jgi:hypothetical protein